MCLFSNGGYLRKRSVSKGGDSPAGAITAGCVLYGCLKKRVMRVKEEKEGREKRMQVFKKKRTRFVVCWDGISKKKKKNNGCK